MKLALIILTALLMLSLALIQIVIFPTFQSRFTESSETWELNYLTDGQITLLAESLKSLTPQQRMIKLEEIRTEFGFTLQLQSLDDHTFTNEQLDTLLAGETAVDLPNRSSYHLIDDNQFIAFISLEELPKHLVSKAERYVMGSLYLINNELTALPINQWDEHFLTIQQRYAHPIALKHIDDTELSEQNIKRLHQGELVIIKTEESERIGYPADLAVQKVGESDRVIYMGPFVDTVLDRMMFLLTIYYVCFGLFILVPVLLWLLPAWFSMKELKTATSSFGQGKFNTRAKLIPLSQLNHLSQTYNEMAERIQGLISSHKTLTNTVSHELRTPIARIEFNIELLRGHIHSDYAIGQLGQIENSVDELNKLVSEMLTYARFDREAPVLKLTNTNLSTWLEDQASTWREANPEMQILVNINTPIEAQIDVFYMNRVINNLIKNAICYGNKQVVISAIKFNHHYRITVEDDGVGVNYIERHDIFTPFYRSNDHKERDKGGSGLGLSIVKLIVDWHKGEVSVKRSLLGGASFRITLPHSISRSAQ
ncbi:hypothetical protein MACH09_11070 [Vibrio sp. MACH09]|uniref:ATP-binding protein n=1 Tax=Vibrio sp. MACH09 TaxID=3025122 RepID=UPI00278CCA06|nr:ATP-binding protein [Vibrio sp. MACH09]GLO60599.1 hypothetical protein MACH09_11070 [Vibrio sp. MACH09]